MLEIKEIEQLGSQYVAWSSVLAMIVTQASYYWEEMVVLIEPAFFLA